MLDFLQQNNRNYHRCFYEACYNGEGVGQEAGGEVEKFCLGLEERYENHNKDDECENNCKAEEADCILPEPWGLDKITNSGCRVVHV